MAQRYVWLGCKPIDSVSVATSLPVGRQGPSRGAVFFMHDRGEECVLSNSRGRNVYGAEVEGLRRVGNNFVAAGRVAYRYVAERGLSGTAFYTPYDNRTIGGALMHPFDIVICTPGNNKTEQIDLSGAIGWQMRSHWSLGASICYTSANRARQKDQRHANSYMNMEVRVGPSYDWRCGMVGASFVYRRQTEGIAFSRVGTTDIVHTALIDYANGLGISETYSGEGWANNTEQPMVADIVGGTLDLALQPSRMVALAVAMEYALREGFYGRRSQYSVQYAVHDGAYYGAKASVSLMGSGWRHRVEAAMAVESLEAWRTNYLSSTIDGVTAYKYFDPTKTADKTRTRGQMCYSATNKQWQFEAGVTFDKRHLRAYVFPTQVATNGTLWRGFVACTAVWSVGHSTANNNADATLSTKIGMALRRCSGHYIPNYEYLTREGLECYGSVQYERQVGITRPYIKVDYSSLHHCLWASVGISF